MRNHCSILIEMPEYLDSDVFLRVVREAHLAATECRVCEWVSPDMRYFGRSAFVRYDGGFKPGRSSK